jgi:hypothetical protein
MAPKLQTYSNTREPSRCTCCRFRRRLWHHQTDTEGYYLDFCQDCLNAAKAVQDRRPIPRIGQGLG